MAATDVPNLAKLFFFAKGHKGTQEIKRRDRTRKKKTKNNRWREKTINLRMKEGASENQEKDEVI